MKAILISIRPQWVALILNLIKKDEIRKGTAIGKAITRLIKEQGVAPMLIYCTKNDKQVLFGQTRNIDLVDYRGTACYGDFRLLRKGDKLTTDDNQPRLNGKVVARFNATVEEIECLGWDFSYDYHLYRTKELSPRDLMLNSRVGYYALEDYLKGKNGTDIRINDLEIFDKPKEISEFMKTLDSFDGIDCWRCSKRHNCSFNRDKKCEKLKLTRAPQSWCYVEVTL